MDIATALAITKFRARISGKLSSSVRSPPGDMPRVFAPSILVKYLKDNGSDVDTLTINLFKRNSCDETALKELFPSVPSAVVAAISTKKYLKSVHTSKDMVLKTVGDEPLSYNTEVCKDSVFQLKGVVDIKTPVRNFIVRTSSKISSEWLDYVLLLFCHASMSSDDCKTYHIVLPLQQKLITFNDGDFPKRKDVLKELESFTFVNRSPMQLAFCETVMELYPVGLHISKSRTLTDTVKSIQGSDRPYQFFLTMNTHMNYTNDDITTAHDIVNTNRSRIYIHSPYLLNLCITPGDKNDYVFECLKQHIIVGSKCGFKGIVVHVGKSTSTPLAQALENMRVNVAKINDLPESKTCPLLIETPAGQGTETLTDIQDFISFVSSFPNVGVCVDTCHVFACGYNPSEYIKTVLNTSEMKSKLKLLHYNDSSDDFGSKKDRHARIGCGKISHTDLKLCADIATMYGIDMVHE
jgi:endonuclease IV